jgi:hypothetical protein
VCGRPAQRDALTQRPAIEKALDGGHTKGVRFAAKADECWWLVYSRLGSRVEGSWAVVSAKKPARRKAKGMPGQVTPARARKEEERFARDMQYIADNMEYWRTHCPNQYVAVYGAKTVAIGNSWEEVINEVRRQGVSESKVIIEFISETATALAL